LDHNLFAMPRKTETLISENDSPMKIRTTDHVTLSKLDDQQWAKYLLENMYHLWFNILNSQIKTSYQDYFKRITEYGNLLF